MCSRSAETFLTIGKLRERRYPGISHPSSAAHSPAEAVRETIYLAQLAEDLGYYRYWLAEHHAIAALADPCPEILVTRIGAAHGAHSHRARAAC